MVLLPCEAWILHIIIVFVSSVWANHGDDISIQYSGTAALKGDFVRYFPWIYSKTCSYLASGYALALLFC